MSNPIKKIVDSSTGEEIEKEMTDEEYSEYIEFIATVEEENKLTKQKEVARKKILDRLGLTEEEARLLLG